MEFTKAMETIMHMHKVCVCGPNEAKKTGKPICPLYHTPFFPCKDICTFENDFKKIEEILEAWNEYYPVETLPTWRKVLESAGITVRCDGTLQFGTRFDADKPISAEFVRMLGRIHKEEQ